MTRFMSRMSALALATATLIASPASAELGVDATTIELKKIESGPQAIEADKGYIYFHASTRTIANFIKVPDEADMAEFIEEWEEEFADAEKDYPRKLARWQQNVEIAERTRRSPSERPVKPTRENFSIGNILFRNVLTVGPQYKFASDLEGQEYSYLTAVEPGTYIYYGGIMMTPVVGSCVCMGTVQFEVTPGVVTDIGNLPSLRAVPSFDRGDDFKLGLPTVLQKYANVEADFRAYGKIDNHYGVRIGRVPAMDGVMRYERDRMIDLKADEGQELAAEDAIEDASDVMADFTRPFEDEAASDL